MSKIDKTSPMWPVEIDVNCVAAVQALERGDATEHQQKLVLQWLVNTVCCTYDLSYRPAEDGRRDTDFAEGKRFVGLTLIKTLKINIMKLKEAKNDRRPK